MELEKAQIIAEELKNRLQDACYDIEIVGDIRRQKPRVGKIKLLCIPAPVEGVPISPDDPLYSSIMSQKWLPEWDDPDAVHDEVMEMMHQNVLDWTSAGSLGYTTTRKPVIHQPSGMAIDILSTDERCWPVALVVATGGAKTIRRIAAAAREKGWRFQSSGDGFDTADGHITCSTEREVFEAVGLPCLPPEQRE
jgi:DNA polymerase/3'-5' exonuclease PolX